MIERELRRAAGGMPSSIRGVIRCACVARFIQYGGESYADSMSSRIAARVSKCADLFNLYIAQTGLFLKFPGSSVLKSFILINESAWKCPPSFERLLSALNEQHP
jgi:hypothetical protein